MQNTQNQGKTYPMNSMPYNIAQVVQQPRMGQYQFATMPVMNQPQNDQNMVPNQPKYYPRY